MLIAVTYRPVARLIERGMHLIVCGPLLVSVFNIILYYPVVSILFTFTVVLVAWFQPYKCKRSNKADIVMLLAMITAVTSSNICIP